MVWFGVWLFEGDGDGDDGAVVFVGDDGEGIGGGDEGGGGGSGDAGDGGDGVAGVRGGEVRLKLRPVGAADGVVFVFGEVGMIVDGQIVFCYAGDLGEPG